MKLFLLVLAVAVIGFTVNHVLYKGREMCSAGKVYAPCNSWQMKYQPFKVHMGKQK